MARRMLVLARLGYVVLFLIIFEMTMKPTGDDVGMLVLMGRFSPSRGLSRSGARAR